jgi:hypothetical protein
MNFSPALNHRCYLACIIIGFLLISSNYAVFADSGPTLDHVSQKAILVTGASTGSGRMIAERLAAKGHFVYAGARKDNDLKALNAIENIQSINLVVTKKSEIDCAVQNVNFSKPGR